MARLPRVPGVPATASVEVKLTPGEREEFVEAARKAGFVRPGTTEGAAGAWLRSLAFQALRQGP